ncbi:MAG: flagellar basal body rod protein FlgB [Dissulfurispiraceae bacterium]|jgi:flagellar basal-body rod protein FlgB|nr:flagellar basal body rod protein FlgB [Dissulfurispiraceae bacterium]
MADNMIVLQKMLDIAVFRHKVLASNIANADTPGYKAKDISFEKELQKAVSGSNSVYEVTESPSMLQNRDLNTVDLNIEMAKVAENTLIYNTATQLLGMKIRMTKDALKGA